MEVLLLGRPGLEWRRAHDVLQSAGHLVGTCHDGAWGCVGLEGTCPLDERDIDVAVAVAEPSDRFDAQGIACLHRARVPIVTVGATADDPVLRFATTSLERLDASTVDAVDDAAHDASGHQRAVEHAISPRLAPDEQVVVEVRRRPKAVAVQLSGRVDPARAAALADVARAALRAYDSRVTVIDISVSGSAPEVPATRSEDR